MNSAPLSLSPTQLLSSLRWRYATKQFEANRPLSEEVTSALKEVLTLTPSSGGLQPWKFLFVTDPAVREQLVPASYGQTQVRDASALVVFAAAKQFSVRDVDAFINHAAKVRGTTPEALAGYRGMLVGGIVEAKNETERQAWAARQTYIALGNLLTSVALLGIDACPMEGFNPADYDRILGLDKTGYTTTVICPVGFRKESDPYASAPKVRFPKEVLVATV